MIKKRYQVYLNPHSVGILDEAAEISDITRSRLIQEVVDAAAGRLGNLLAFLKPRKKGDYSELDKLMGAIKIQDKEQVNLSENVDEIYY